MDLPTIQDLRRAADILSAAVHRTPVMTSRSLDRITGARLFFKCENFQRAGAFFKSIFLEASRVSIPTILPSVVVSKFTVLVTRCAN